MADQGSAVSETSGRTTCSTITMHNLIKACVAAAGVVFLASCWRWGGNHLLPPHSRTEEGSGASTTGTAAVQFNVNEQQRLDSTSGAFSNNGGGGLPLVELHNRERFGNAVALKSERIVYCPIQKVACTEWLKVFRWMDGQDNWEQPRHVKHGLDVLQKMGLEKANRILNSEKWLKFAVVREPAERLLSCFLQKCNKWNFKKEYGNCPYLELWPELFGDDRFPGGVPSTPRDETLDVILEAFLTRGRHKMFADYVESIVRRVKANPCGQNGHWAPQYCHCSLDVTAPVFQIVGWNNMTEGAAAAIVPAASSQQRGKEIAEFLDSRMGSNHEKSGKKTGAGSAVDESYSEDMLHAVHEAFAKDYEIFAQYWE